MSDSVDAAKDRIRRSIGIEFDRMEDDFDKTRNIRSGLIDKLAEAANKVSLLGEKDEVTDETEGGLKILTTTLKALNDVEKAAAQAVLLKLKNQEQELASATAAKDRVAMVLLATQPGKLAATFASEDLEQKLDEMFHDDIKDFELKSNPKDLSDS